MGSASWRGDRALQAMPQHIVYEPSEQPEREALVDGRLGSRRESHRNVSVQPAACSGLRCAQAAAVGRSRGAAPPGRLGSRGRRRLPGVARSPNPRVPLSVPRARRARTPRHGVLGCGVRRIRETGRSVPDGQPLRAPARFQSPDAYASRGGAIHLWSRARGPLPLRVIARDGCAGLPSQVGIAITHQIRGDGRGLDRRRRSMHAGMVGRRRLGLDSPASELGATPAGRLVETRACRIPSDTPCAMPSSPRVCRWPLHE